MKKYLLKNGLTVIEEKRESDSVTIELIVKTGSNNEKAGIRGISHFIEHMLFEGTVNRSNAKEISNEIESIGGEINAYTENTRTCFYVKVPKKYFRKAAEILADIVKNPLFREENIDKEREVILKEINIFNDESRFYQWILFEKLLFGNSPRGYPAYGTIEDVKSIGREQILNYFNAHYLANNSILTIVGDIRESRRIIGAYFGDFRKGKVVGKVLHVPGVIRSRRVKIRRKITNSYMVLGYRTVSRLDKDSCVLDVIQAILGKGQSGKIFDEIRNKRGLAYEVGVTHDSGSDTGFFAVYLSAEKKNIPLIKKLIFKEFKALQKISYKEIEEAKGFVSGKHVLDSEDTHSKADALGFWESVGDARLENSYTKRIGMVGKQDILRVAKKYLNKNYSLAIIESL